MADSPDLSSLARSRRGVLTMEKVEAICAVIATGVAEHVAAGASGVNARTWRFWVKRGKDAAAEYEKAIEGDPYATAPESERIYLELYDRVQAARDKSESRAIQIIRRAAEVDWRAEAWWLTHSRRERFADTTKHEHSGPDGKPIETRGTIALTDITKLTAVITANTEDDENGDGGSDGRGTD